MEASNSKVKNNEYIDDSNNFNDDFALLECMIVNDFDTSDTRNGETIIFDLIRQNKVKTLELLPKKIVKEKENRFMMNYYNNAGISPLYLAIKQDIQRKNVDDQTNNKENI